jgi:hypothetical protein
MATAIDTLIDELYRTPEKAEIVGGRIIHMSPAGDIHGYAALEVTVSKFAGKMRGYFFTAAAMPNATPAATVPSTIAKNSLPHVKDAPVLKSN